MKLGTSGLARGGVAAFALFAMLTAASAQRDSRTAIVAYGTDASTLDPQQINSRDTQNIADHVWGSLYEIDDDGKLTELLADLTAELVVEKPGKEIVMSALVGQVLVQMLRHHSNIRWSDELELSRVGLIDRRIRRSVELMHTQVDQDLSLKDLAAASYLSPFHFARLFKKLTGATPHNYLAAIRTTRAQLLLAETDLSITEIGARVGYLSSSHFTKAFRLATGTTPREFRKALVGR